MRSLKVLAGGNGWTKWAVGWALLGGVVSAGVVACSTTEPTEKASEPAARSEEIGQTRQAVTNSPYVPSGYYCKTNDEFGGDFGLNQANSNIDSTKWSFQNTNVNNEAQNYTTRQCIANPSDWNYCVANGRLTIQARNVALDCSNTGNAACADMILNGTEQGAPNKSYTSGRLNSKTKWAAQYGYIEFKARLPFQGGSRQSGLWPALWFLGSTINEGPGSAGGTAWPWAPEFDLMEWQSQAAHDIVLNGVSHPMPAGMMASNAIYIGSDGNMDACNVWPETGGTDCYNGANAQAYHKFDNAANPATGAFNVNDWSGSIIQGWHTYGLLWTSSSMTAYIDGANQGHVNISGGGSEFQAPMFMLMNLAVGGDLGGPIQVSNWAQATLEVDYVRWYQSGGSDTCTGGGGGCTAETNTQFCQRLGKSCGSVTANDNCGTSRTVSSCGTCNSPQTCSANICDGGGTTVQLQAESKNGSGGGNNVGTETCTDTGGGTDVMDVGDGEYIYFNNVNFANLTTFQARVATNTDGYATSIEFRNGSTTGTLLGTCYTPITGGWQNWTTVSCNESGGTGTGTLYVVFHGAHANSMLSNVNWIKLFSSGGTCTPETDPAFCSRLGKNCGSVTAADNCGTNRTVSSCGTCTSPATCGGGGTANVCGSGCTAETNTAFCSRLGKNCGSVTANDNCGTSRTVSSCGTCTSPATCGGGGTANVCGGGGGGTCWTAYAQGNCLSYVLNTHVSSGGHNWNCSNGNCANCASDTRCAPGGTGCPWGVVWSDQGTCQ